MQKGDFLTTRLIYVPEMVICYLVNTVPGVMKNYVDFYPNSIMVLTNLYKNFVSRYKDMNVIGSEKCAAFCY